MATYGYAGRILRVDLSSGSTAKTSTLDYAERFLGGRGIAAKIYWDEVSPEVSAFDAESRLIFAIGPLAGLPVIGSSRWTVCGKSPASTPEHFCYSNLGGRWGAELKFAGYDAIVVQGRSERPVYLLLHDDAAELKDASTIWGTGAIETRQILKSQLGGSVKLVAIGPAGENMVTMASLLADNDASGSGGLGAVMGSKRLKAIAIRGGEKRVRVAQPEKLRELTTYFRECKRYLITSLDGREWAIRGPKTRKDPCYGCLGCGRMVYQAENGKEGKFMCQSAMLYQPWAQRYYGEYNEVPFYATKLCDEYGLDTWAMNAMIAWMNRCYRAGILSDEKTSMPISKLGSLEFIETLLRKVSVREGFGDILAQGIVKAADSMGPEAVGQIRYNDPYDPRLYITTALLYAMEPRPPLSQIHEISFSVGKWLNWVKRIEGAHLSTDVIRGIAKRFWGGEMAADFSTYEGKALAAKRIQDREYAKECLILCDFLWPVMDVACSEDHVGDPTLESKVVSAVIGNEVDEEGLCRIGERVFNLQRAIITRENPKGRDFDTLPDDWHTVPLKFDIVNPECLVPGREGEITSRKGAVVDREEFEGMKDEYYQLRQWDVATGLQARARLEELGLTDVVRDLEQRGILGGSSALHTS